MGGSALCVDGWTSTRSCSTLEWATRFAISDILTSLPETSKDIILTLLSPKDMLFLNLISGCCRVQLAHSGNVHGMALKYTFISISTLRIEQGTVPRQL